MTERYHEGEVALQELAGERDKAILNGKVILPAIQAGARKFLRGQRHCVLGWLSPEGEIWSTFLQGPSGFADVDDDGTSVRLGLGSRDEIRDSIPPFSGLRKGDGAGLLFIEFSTRRRLRINGAVAEFTGDRLRLDVHEAFPNCPKYIQKRDVEETRSNANTISHLLDHGQDLNGHLADWITKADTFFVASAHSDGSVDVSHRGGRPGFIRDRDGEIRIPDYPGNSMFRTLGNFHSYPKGGLAFVDFDRHCLLQLTGDVRLELDFRGDHEATGGTGRWWIFSPRKWIISSLLSFNDWRLVESSPFNP